MALVPTGFIDLIDEPILLTVVGALGLPEGTVERYRLARPGASNGDLLAVVLTDRSLRIPAVRVAEARLEAGETDTSVFPLTPWPAEYGFNVLL